jgi:alkylation response protein AidB-like acyl-CoA dehydrogenase
MDFKFTEEQDRFRQEVRDFLEGEIKRGLFQPACDGWIQGFSPEFTKKVAEKGWLGLNWPKEYGGQGRSNVDRFILTEEMLRYGAPAALHWFADRQIGRAIIHFGTPEQKKDMLPKILRGEAYVGLGMSEPEAGSDLGSLQTKANEEGDSYVLNGQKMWTSCARYMNYMYLVARTDPNAPKHRGISEFIIPSNLPGISIRPTIDITGTEAWGEVFFDNVKIPKTALIGEKNRGFYQIVNQLDFERSGLERLMGNYPLFDAIVQFSKETKRNGKLICREPLIRDKLARLQVEFDIGRLLTYRVALVMDSGRAPNMEAAMAKAYCTAFEQHLADLSTRILGLYGQLIAGSKWTPIMGMAPHSFLGSMGYSLQAGTSEILRNVVATRGLGLPEA